MGLGTCTWRFMNMVWVRVDNCSGGCDCGDEVVNPNTPNTLSDAQFASLMQQKLAAGKRFSVKLFANSAQLGPSTPLSVNSSNFERQRGVLSRNPKARVEYPCVNPTPIDPTGAG